MTAEDWELRREARRCLYSASQAQTVREQEMLQGYARFYDALAAGERNVNRGIEQSGEDMRPSGGDNVVPLDEARVLPPDRRKRRRG